MIYQEGDIRRSARFIQTPASQRRDLDERERESKILAGTPSSVIESGREKTLGRLVSIVASDYVFDHANPKM